MFGALLSVMAFNSSRHRLEIENAAFAAGLGAGSMVLDAGAGEAPYRHLFEHMRYESADFHAVDKPYAQTTYVCDLTSIPTECERYDAVLFNQVMEHLPRPAEVLDELFRVLKPGGRIIYSGPLFFEEHEKPYDFYRYTQFGVRHLFEQAGFEIDRLDWLEGYFGTVAYQLNRMARYLPTRPGALGSGSAIPVTQRWSSRFGSLTLRLAMAPLLLMLRACFGTLSVLFHRLELRFKVTAAGYPKNYVAIATRPQATICDAGGYGSDSGTVEHRRSAPRDHPAAGPAPLDGGRPAHRAQPGDDMARNR